ncbi:Fe-S cluster assembly protein SufD [Ferrovibrio terrae]|uniref:Fe-S cluster assembly protein SufD n=1 Tax=Ferrovibrio terrae TaxID=2594003 RepID=UPI003137CD2C
MSALPFVEQLAGAYRAAASSLPGAKTPAVAARRDAALEAFRRLGLPNHKLESWKFTGLNALERQSWSLPANDGGIDAARLKAAALTADSHRLVFVNGRFDAAASMIGALPKGATLLPLSQAGDAVQDALVAAGDDRTVSLSELNAALASDGVVLLLDDGVQLDRPVEILNFGTPALVNLRHLIRLGRHAQATVLESYRDGGIAQPGWSNVFARVAVGEGARLTHIRLQGENPEAYHAALGRVSIGAGAHYAHVSVQAGAALARHELHVAFAGSNATADIQGLVLARGKAHLDHTLFLHHAVPECRSNQLFKHVVDDEGHAVFQGGIRVAPHAQKTDAQQLSRTLLLADRAQIDTKPELEILADDVKCSHGASIGDVDAQQMFYMQARGIPAHEARRLLLSGFAHEVVSAVPEGALRDHVEGFVEAWLAEKGVAA